jgi:hypothetical protein
MVAPTHRAMTVRAEQRRGSDAEADGAALAGAGDGCWRRVAGR